MPKAETLIAIATGISNIALAILTAVYVWLTRALLRQAKSSQEQSEAAVQIQIHYATMPQLQMEAGISQLSGRWLSISNWSQNPAIDLDLWLLIPYSDIEKEPFEKMLKCPSAQQWKCDHSGLFNIKERFIYPMLPPKHRINFRLLLPDSGDFKCFYQFRNVSGQNYCGLTWFYKSDRNPSKFAIGSVEPEVPLAVHRIEWGEEIKFPQLPFFSEQSDFRHYFLKSLDVAKTWSELTDEMRIGDVDDSGDLERLDGVS